MVEDGRINSNFQIYLTPYIFEFTAKLLYVRNQKLSMINLNFNDYVELIEAKRFGDRNTINIEGYGRKSSKNWFLGRKRGEELDDSTRFTQ